MLRSKPIYFAFVLLFTLGSSRGWADHVLVKAQSLSLRTTPSMSSKRKLRLPTYEPVEVLKRRKDWTQVKTVGGETGWVLSKYLTETAFISVNHDKLNVRLGPGTQYEVKMIVLRTYPFKVLKRAEGWLLVQDFDGDKGWISEKLVSLASYVITDYVDPAKKRCNIRTGPGTHNRVAFTAQRGVILRVIAPAKDGWLKVRHADGDEGYISAKIVFGWLDSNSS